MLAKYDFSVSKPEGEDLTNVQFKVDMPADRYLLNFMRLKIIEKTEHTETAKVTILNSMNLSNLNLAEGEYCLIVEGVFPYNTADG